VRAALISISLEEFFFDDDDDDDELFMRTPYVLYLDLVYFGFLPIAY
jgi:hypothetical protein